MFILSGELVIILRTNNFTIHNRYIKSMRFAVLLILIVAGIIPLILFNLVYVSSTKSQLIDKRIELLSKQCTVLKNSIISKGDVNDLDYEITSLYDSRIVVIDKSYKVAWDSYHIDRSKYCISKAVINAFNGSDLKNYDSDYELVEFVVGMTASEEDKPSAVLYVTYSVKDIQTSVNQLMINGNIMISLFSVLIVIFAIIVAERFVKPLKRIEDGIELATVGVFDRTIKESSFSETKNIADAFNGLVAKLDEYENSRQEFVSNVSHELKTPITSIKVLADAIVSREDAPVELYKEFMSDIVSEIDRENDIINDLLTLVRMDRNATALNMEKVSINDLIELILKRIHPIAESKNIEVVYESLREVYADVDEKKLTMAITNLVENAVKYNVDDGWVRISLNSDSKYFYVRVEDSGIGIAKEDYDKIFERFYRVDKARSRETGGTGLGLSITKNIILMHKGNIKVSSEEGHGTTFAVRIPLVYTPPEDAERQK